MKRKVFIIILILLLIISAFFIGRQVGLNADDEKTTVTITEAEVTTQNIKKTLTSSGQVEAAITEKLSLSTSKYFYAMDVENDDTVKKGEKILEYSNGTYLEAPYDCVVISSNLPDTGEKATSSNYVEISGTEDLTATISINENEINEVKEDQEVEITLTADESKTYEGKISKIDSVGTYASSGTTFSAVVEFENDGNIKLGMSISCTVILQEEENVTCVPIEAVYENNNGEEYVNKINSDGTIEELIIETGIADDSYVQITSGLELGEKVQIIKETTESTTTDSSENSGFGGERGNMNMDMTGGRENIDMPSGMGEIPSMGGGSMQAK